MLSSKRILLVDDNRKILKFIEVGLRLRGFDVTAVETGQEGLEEVRAREPDVMLLDIIMPEIDGFEVLRQLRQFSGIHVIAYSASPSNGERAISLGANCFMTKPFDLDVMVRKIMELLDIT